MKIEVCERLMDRTLNGKPRYHAQIEGQPGFWGCGDSMREAIADLILTHSEKLNLEVEYLGKLPRQFDKF